ncbi:MAG: HNH endonuclease, partial [Actinomycetes bacterium]
MSATSDDPLALGQRVVSVLETGARTATYKLATLMALVDHCVEHLPARPGDPLAVPVRDLALRVVELYWPQVRTFESKPLRQSTQPVAKILDAVMDLRSATGAGDSGMSFAVASVRVPHELDRTLDLVALTMVRQPLHRLQKLPNGSGEPFLYDDSWMHDSVSRRTLAQHGNEILLFHGVASGLARLSGLLRPALELLWVEDVRRMNRWLGEDVPDVAGHLFGRERISLAPAREALTEAFGPRCFYCERKVGASSPV